MNAHNEQQYPSYEALDIIVRSVAGALSRAGVTECDDPGEAIDVLRERYERRIAELLQPAAAPGIDLTPFRQVAKFAKYWADEVGSDEVDADADRLLALIDGSPKGGSDPWRGLYAPECAPSRDEYGCFYHPDIPSWDDEREESIAPLLKAQGFDSQCVPGDFSDEAMEEGGERYWQEMREWNPESEGDGWRLAAIYDTEDGPYSMFVKPLALAGDAEVQP